MPGRACPMPPASGRALCFSVTASQPLCLWDRATVGLHWPGRKCVLTTGTLPSCASQLLVLRGDALSLGSQTSWGRCEGPAQWQRQSLRNPLLVIWNGLDDRCIMCAFHMVQRSHRRELSGTIKNRVGLLWRDLIAKIWPYKTDNPGVMIPFTPTPFPSPSEVYSVFKSSCLRANFQSSRTGTTLHLGCQWFPSIPVPRRLSVWKVISVHAQPRTAVLCCRTGDRDSRGLKNNEWNPNPILVISWDKSSQGSVDTQKPKVWVPHPWTPHVCPGQWTDITSCARHPGRHCTAVCNQERTKHGGKTKQRLDLVRADDVLIIIHNNTAKQSWCQFWCIFYFPQINSSRILTRGLSRAVP